MLDAIRVIIICVVLVLLELAVAALIVAPRAMARKLISALRALKERAKRVLAAAWSRRGSAHPSRGES